MPGVGSYNGPADRGVRQQTTNGKKGRETKKKRRTRVSTTACLLSTPTQEPGRGSTGFQEEHLAVCASRSTLPLSRACCLVVLVPVPVHRGLLVFCTASALYLELSPVFSRFFVPLSYPNPPSPSISPPSPGSWLLFVAGLPFARFCRTAGSLLQRSCTSREKEGRGGERISLRPKLCLFLLVFVDVYVHIHVRAPFPL